QGKGARVQSAGPAGIAVARVKTKGMKRLTLIFAITLACSLLLFAAGPKPDDSLDAVLKKMDSAAASFRSAQAEFEWDKYEKVIDEIDDVQKGTIYYRRNGKEIEMMAEVKTVGNDANTLKPDRKYVLFNEGKIRMYQPKPDQVTVYDLGKKRSEFESYVVL